MEKRKTTYKSDWENYPQDITSPKKNRTETHAVHITSLRFASELCLFAKFLSTRNFPRWCMDGISPIATSFPRMSTRVDQLINQQFLIWRIRPKIWPKKNMKMPTGSNGDPFARVFFGGRYPNLHSSHMNTTFPATAVTQISQIQESEEKSRAIHKVMAFVYFLEDALIRLCHIFCVKDICNLKDLCSNCCPESRCLFVKNHLAKREERWFKKEPFKTYDLFVKQSEFWRTTE